MLPVRRIGKLIKRPDLHGRDTHVEQLAGELTRAVFVLPLEEVFEWTRVLADAPTFRKGSTRVMRLEDVVAVACAGVVDAHPLSNRATQAAIDGQPDALAEQVPQGDIDCRQTPHLGAHGTVCHALAQRVGVSRDLARVLAEQVWGGRLVDVGCHGGRPVERFAEPYEILIGVEANPEKIRVRAARYGFDLGDAHVLCPIRTTPPGRCWNRVHTDPAHAS